eukprot:CAMPEP_0203667208 /NCGR_PEP_ID=MMETSP0090-20130426/4089_1 /ASSEMBLY_ACC=CAM_ASM_001088 /TAXON_ID=426623 /ORGANISM="Chaetoceros affinis, Strain CCMP159" /LENGTH=309 /DNA_ID=CAMNT_0050531311 /DNA_START=42 /DNA_END=971 /DNA_ORIENTATION=+
MNKQNNNKAKKNNNKAKKNKKSNNKTVALSKALSWITRHAAPKLNLPISTDGYIPLKAILKCQARNMQSYTVDDILYVVETNEKQRFKLCEKYVMWETRTKAKKQKRQGGSSVGSNDDCMSITTVQEECYTFVDGEGNDDNDSSNDAHGSNDNKDSETSNINNRRIVLELCIRANQGHSITGINCEELLTPIPPDELSNLDTIVHRTNKDAWENHIQTEGLNKMNRNHIHFAHDIPSPSQNKGVISGMRLNSQIYIYVNGKACADDGIQFYRSSNGVILTPGLENGTLPVRYFSSVIDAKTKEELLTTR